jgi:hypothetical protein
MLEVSRNAAASGEEQLVSCLAEQSKYCSICTVTLDPCGDLLFTSWGRWQCLRGGADVGLDSCYAACGCGTEYRCGALPGGGRVVIHDVHYVTDVLDPKTIQGRSEFTGVPPPSTTAR